jgi:plastocyanin
VSRRLALLAAAALLALASTRLSPARPATGSVEALVRDERGTPMADAVVSLTPPGAVPLPRPAPAVMDQHNKEFVPHVLPVLVGTPVAFPNRDNIRHHVYSFSRAKKFELPLYIGTPAAPVLFDRPGPVVLGCNIHDWMVGYVYVLPTPYFARTGDDGRARLADVPPGSYEARAWHPRMKGVPEQTGRPLALAAGDTGQVAFVVALKPERRPARPAPTYESAPQS